MAARLHDDHDFVAHLPDFLYELVAEDHEGGQAFSRQVGRDRADYLEYGTASNDRIRHTDAGKGLAGGVHDRGMQFAKKW